MRLEPRKSLTVADVVLSALGASRGSSAEEARGPMVTTRTALGR